MRAATIHGIAITFAIAAFVTVACSAFDSSNPSSSVAPSDAGGDGASSSSSSGDAATESTTPPVVTLEAIASVTNLRAIAADSAGVVWIDGTQVRGFVPGGAPFDAFEEGEVNGYLHLLKGVVYIARRPAITVCNWQTCSTTLGTFMYNVKNAGPLTHVGDKIYATEQDSARRVITCDVKLNACGDVNAGNTKAQINVASTNVPAFIGATESVTVIGSPTEINSYQASVPTAFLPVANGLVAMAADDTGVYWREAGSGNVKRTKLPALNVTIDFLVSDASAKPRDFVIQGTRIYFLDDAEGGRVASCATSETSCTPKVHGTNLGDVNGLAIGADTNRIYFGAKSKIWSLLNP